MPDVICNTSPLQYLHQMDNWRISNGSEYKHRSVPPAGPLITGLGPGESQVLMLALEIPGSVALLDDALARRIAICCSEAGW